MKKKALVFVLFFITLISFCGIFQSVAMKKGFLINTDYVPNAETAIKIAEAVWLPIYGEKIYENKPFKAKLKNSNVWIVQGTLKNDLGGVPYIEIQKKDCKILKVYHGK